MKLLSILFFSGLFLTSAYAEEPPTPMTVKEKTNYSIGVNEIRNFRQNGVEIDINMLIQGMRDAFSGEKLRLKEEEIQEALGKVQGELRMRQRGLKRPAPEVK